MIVAGLQLDIAWEEPAENFRRAAELAVEAAAVGARLLVLPEMFATGFSMRSEAMAEHAPAVRTFLADTATRHEVWVVGGFAEPGDDRPANACSVIAPDGSERLHYRKIHPFAYAGEAEHYAAGDDLVTVAVEGLRFTLFVCYDLRFADKFWDAALGTDVYIVVANWPEPRRHHWWTNI